MSLRPLTSSRIQEREFTRNQGGLVNLVFSVSETFKHNSMGISEAQAL